MSKSRFDQFNAFIRKRRRLIIIAWIVALAVSLIFIPSFFSSVSYNVTGGVGGPTNTESQKAANILSTEFPGSNNGSSTSILVVFQGNNVYSDSVKNGVLSLNDTISNDVQIGNYTGMTSVYSTEYGILNSSLPSLVAQVTSLESKLGLINSGVFTLQQNLSSLSGNLFQLEMGINQTSQLIYGIPAGFLRAWEGAEASGITNPNQANVAANASIYQATNNFGGSQESIGYYSTFYQAWNMTFSRLPNSTTPLAREADSIKQAVSVFSSNPSLDSATKQIIGSVSTGLNVSDWNQMSSISNLTITTLASSIPSQLSSSLGTSPESLVTELYKFGPSPSNALLSNYTISLFEANLSKNSSGASLGISVSQLVRSSYDLGSSYNFSAAWKSASSFVANATQSVFSTSPLFHVNAPSLQNLLSTLPNGTAAEIRNSVTNVVRTQSFDNYPYIPTRSLTQNLVSKDNQTTIIIFNFSHLPSPGAITRFKTDVDNSNLHNLGSTYVTGSSVISQDLQNAFTPALSITIGPGVAISILIVALLFLSPIAMLIPILMGGISISIALSAIYVGLVKIGHGNITFLTPTLTILLVLGLAVDYAVLQLRRTREERLNQKSTEDSVAISVKWAGQAVLTAGITVIVAYIVMAVANVPLFSDVGTAIALGVSVLLAASLTLLPALELSLGDRIFWPSLARHMNNKSPRQSRLDKIAKGTLKNKVVIAAVISAFALSAFYASYTTPTGSNFLKLIPNFPSNQGLTVITNSLGSGTIAPATIILTTPTPIVDGQNHFNKTLLNQIETISNIAANSSGVLSLTGPTRPYGAPFNYDSINNLSEPVRIQYLSGVISQIGKDNKTALITFGLSDPSESQAAISSLLAVENNVNRLSLSKGEVILFGGDTQGTFDSQSFLNGLLPQVIAILAVAVYVILFIQLRSAFTPVRLIFTILCSVVFSLAILSLVFYYSLNLPILNFAPLFVIVTMLGVGIDYDIFFVTRIREEVLNGKSDNEAIVTAVNRVWVTILGLGLVLSTVFGSLLITGIAIFQEISLAVASAILVDVLIVILFFVPSLMGLAQRLNWWPTKIQRAKQENKENP
ncbi:MAG: MMPL family transporter [Thaumarchaeota archaeon]|nr:MMPL family transporter [Nitrososphaerota archaeon]